MSTCADCIWFGGFVEDAKMYYVCDDPDPTALFLRSHPQIVCRNFVERKTMNLEKAYEVLQAAWVKEYKVEVGDTVRVLRLARGNELGCSYQADLNVYKTELIGKCYEIQHIASNHLVVFGPCGRVLWFPFFCLEFIKKNQPKIEITCVVNGESVPLNTLSEETLLNIRNSK